jgi:PAS domain S-box-containing protein
VLVVAATAATDALLHDAAVARTGLALERAVDADAAIVRVEGADPPDVVLLAPGLPDPVRVAQRLHSLDRAGAVIAMAEPDGEAELRHALEVAPFLEGDVRMVVTDQPVELAEELAFAAVRTRDRRLAQSDRKKRRETPPPLSARYLGTLLDSVPIGIVTLDGAGAVIGWNKRTGDMLGVAEVEALGQPFTELFADDDRERLATLIDELDTSGVGDKGEIFERRGRSYEVTGARFAIRSGEGGSLLILQDVTTRRVAERELELQRALMAAQADSSEVGITVVTLDGSVERMNRRWTEIWGVDAGMIRDDREAATRVMLDQVVDPEGFLAGSARLAESPDGEFRDEVALRDGRVIERFATHVRGDDGALVGRIWFHTDITAHRREEEALRFLADATNLLSSSLDYTSTLQRVADLAVPRIAGWCSVEIAEQAGQRTIAIAHTDRALPETPGSAMNVPIKVRDRVFGSIKFIRSPGDPAYDRDDLKLAEELARRAAMAIDNSLIHTELRNTARTLQESLLPPHLPAARGLELAARFRPAGAGMEVGGDFYDIFETGPEQWGLVLGDVCGKGAEAASLTALTRYTVRTAAMYEQDTAGVLRVLNEALLRQRGDYRFTTLVFCVVDLSGERPLLRTACGGHPRPLCLRADGTVQALGATGPLLGVLPAATFTEEQVVLDRGDSLALYTDGLTDALAPQHILEEEDLLDVLGDCKGASAGEIARQLEAAALPGDASQVPRDDIALVVARLV